MKSLLSLYGVLLLFQNVAWSQRMLQGMVVNEATKQALPGAVVQLLPAGARLLTDSMGSFTLKVDSALEEAEVRVEALGVDTVFQIFPQSATLFQFRVLPKSILLSEVAVRGVSPRKIVERAMHAIPQNYPDSSYVYYGFYRQYQRQNARFQNLVEVQVAALVRPQKTKTALKADLSFAPLNLQKEAVQPVPIEDVPYREGISEQLFEENPVYFPEYSTLTSGLLDHCIFSFDPLQSDSEYIIHYQADVSSEDHGFPQKWGSSSLLYESYEKGTLTIDRKTLAFRRIVRQSFRTPHLDYYHYFNWVQPSKKLTREFVSGNLDVQFVKRASYWVLSQICHGYTNDYYSHHPYQKRYTLSEFYEWQTESVTRQIPAELQKRFSAKPYLHLQSPFEGTFSLQGKAFPFLFFEDEAMKEAFAHSQ